MATYSLSCRTCDWTTAPEERTAGCPECGGRLEVSHDALPEKLATHTARHDLFRYAGWLPTAGIEWKSNGEGWTPLVEAPTLAGLDADGDTGNVETTVLVKNETTNPTWSWKDRMAALLVAHLAADGADRIATSTSGNHGDAVAAYATRLDVDHVLAFLGSSSEEPHHAQIRAYGGETVELTDDDERTRLLDQLAARGWTIAYNLDGHYTGQPYVYEGYKTIAFELVEQYGVPDAVVAAVGAGDGLYGVWKGFRELERAGLVETTPRMVSVEAEARHPLAAAYERDAETVGEDHGPEPLNTSTKGTTTGDHALAAVRDSGGEPLVIDRETLERALQAVGADGVFLEPASALAAAGAARLAGRSDGETIVAVGSGAGVGWPQTTSAVLGDHETVDPSLAAVDDAVSFSVE